MREPKKAATAAPPSTPRVMTIGLTPKGVDNLKMWKSWKGINAACWGTLAQTGAVLFSSLGVRERRWGADLSYPLCCGIDRTVLFVTLNGGLQRSNLDRDVERTM